jgi:hypothetical protein
MRETYPKGSRAPGGRYLVCCRACGRRYTYHACLGNRACPSCRREVPVSERALLPAEERRVMFLVEGVKERRER